MLPSLSPQCVQFGESPLIAHAPCGDAVAQPILFHRDLASEPVLLAGLLLERGVAPWLECLETFVEGAGNAAVEPYGGARASFEQPTVVADQYHAGAHLSELAFEPLDTWKIKMIGRLVEQQDIGRGRERAGQGSSARLAP